MSRSALLTAIRLERESRKTEDDRKAERSKLLASHLGFTRKFFLEKEGQPFTAAPFHPVICGALDRVFTGEIKRLIINIPPGYGKTELAVVNFIARGFAINPRARFIHASYAQALALDNSSKVKDVIALEGYQAHWPVRMRLDTNAKGLWRTTDGGHLRAAASGEPITGFRAGILSEPGFTGALVIDDPLKPDDASSDTTRKFINERWENTFRSRLAHEDVPIIVIMQRLHVDDFIAHLLERSGEHWHLLRLPVLVDGQGEAPQGDVTLIEHGLPNGPLWSEKHTQEQIKVLQNAPQVYAGQYSQSPVIAGGNLFKTEWLLEHDDLPKLKWRAIYVDTAQKTKERNDYSVFEHWGAGVDGKAYLIDLVRGRFEAPELEKTALAIWEKAKALDPAKFGHLRKMAVEDKVSGTGLIQAVKRKSVPVIAVQREKDKYTRALDAVPSVAAGMVSIPKRAPWKLAFTSEYAAFPDGSFDDQVDPFIDAVVDMCGGGSYTLANVS